MHEIFEELEEELTPFGHQSLEVLGLDSKQLITLITDRAEKRVKEQELKMPAVKFFKDAAKCMENIRKCPAPPKSSGH